MASRPEPTDTLEPDWFAVTQAAQALGSGTRRLVALHDTETAIAWCLQMSREHSGVTALSYYELAVMLGHRDKKTRERAALEWNSLLREVEALAGAVKVKADEEKRAAEEEAAAAAKLAHEKAVRHSERFRQVSNRYPLRVTEAYDGDFDQAAADSDEQVAEKVAEWERAHGLEPRDWPAIGAEERAESGSSSGELVVLHELAQLEDDPEPGA
jgi:hypothetical protein